MSNLSKPSTRKDQRCGVINPLLGCCFKTLTSAIKPSRLSKRANLVNRHARRRKRLRSKRAERRAKFNDSPVLATSALSKQRTPKLMILFFAITAHPTEAMPTSIPKDNSSFNLYFIIFSFTMHPL